MKNTPENDSQERLSDNKQAANEAGLPERIKLPSTVQLAQIAAGFGVQTHPADAVKKAVSLFLRATAFIAKNKNAPVRDLARACGDSELDSQLATAAFVAPFNRTYLLEPGKQRDEVRHKLASCGLKKLSKAESVLENLEAMHRLAHIRTFLEAKQIQMTQDGKPLWLWGTITKSELGETQSTLNEAHKAKCLMITRKKFDDKTEVLAKKNGWRETDHKTEWQRELTKISVQQENGRVVYRVPGFWLGELIEWKKSRKVTGGKKGHFGKKTSKTS